MRGVDKLMPPLPLVLSMHAVLPWLSTRGRAVINTIASFGVRAPPAERLATILGLENRFQLARLLRREGLPAVGELADWASLLHLLLEYESSGKALVPLARHAGIEPATCYRRYQRMLGVTWTEARKNGFGWALTKFAECARRPQRPRVEVPRRAAPVPPSRSTAVPSTVGPAIVGVRTMRPGMRLPAPPTANGIHPQGGATTTLRLGARPYDVAITRDGFAYVVRADAAAVERLDLRLRKVVASIPVGCNPTRVVFDRRGLRAYVSNQFSESISVIDVATNRRINEIAVNGWPAPVLIGPDERTLYVSTTWDHLYAISLLTGRVTAAIPLPATSHHLAVHPGGKRLYVATRTAGTVMEIALPTHEVLRTFKLGGQPQGVAVAADGSELYVANEKGGLDVVHLRTGVQTASVKIGGSAFGLALSPDGAQLYASLVAAERVQVIDRATLKVVRTIPTGGIPREVVIDPGGSTAVIANEAGWVTVVG